MPQRTAARLFATWVAVMSGGAGLILYAYFAYRAARGNAVPASDEWAIFTHVALLVFIIAAFVVLRQERHRGDAAEQAIRNMRRAEEQRRFYSGPSGYTQASLARLRYEAATPHGLNPEANAAMEELVAKAITGLNADTLYIIRRERHRDTFGPFLESRAGRYGRLSWADATAEAARLLENGMAEKVIEPGASGRLRWTQFGRCVIGNLGPRLSRW